MDAKGHLPRHSNPHGGGPPATRRSKRSGHHRTAGHPFTCPARVPRRLGPRRVSPPNLEGSPCRARWPLSADDCIHVDQLREVVINGRWPEYESIGKETLPRSNVRVMLSMIKPAVARASLRDGPHCTRRNQPPSMHGSTGPPRRSGLARGARHVRGDDGHRRGQLRPVRHAPPGRLKATRPRIPGEQPAVQRRGGPGAGLRGAAHRAGHCPPPSPASRSPARLL